MDADAVIYLQEKITDLEETISMLRTYIDKLETDLHEMSIEKTRLSEEIEHWINKYKEDAQRNTVYVWTNVSPTPNTIITYTTSADPNTY